MKREVKISLDNTYMNVIQFGSGKKQMVMIAGVSLCGLEGQLEAVSGAYSLFDEDYTISLFDRRKVLPEGFMVSDMANDVLTCLDELGIEKADFYGVSQGGMIAQYIAIHHPERVNKLVLCSTISRPTEVMLKNAKEWLSLAKEKDVVGLNRHFFNVVYSKAFLEGVKDLLPVLEQQGTAADCERFEVLANALLYFDVYDKLDKIKCPVLVLGDKNDHTIGVDGMMELIDKLDCESYLYDCYSHAVYDEASDIKGRIKEFLDK